MLVKVSDLWSDKYYNVDGATSEDDARRIAFRIAMRRGAADFNELAHTTTVINAVPVSTETANILRYQQ